VVSERGGCQFLPSSSLSAASIGWLSWAALVTLLYFFGLLLRAVLGERVE